MQDGRRTRDEALALRAALRRLPRSRGDSFNFPANEKSPCVGGGGTAHLSHLIWLSEL